MIYCAGSFLTHNPMKEIENCVFCFVSHVSPMIFHGNPRQKINICEFSTVLGKR